MGNDSIGFNFTDRYKALGIKPPNIDTMCTGWCEGTGWIPHQKYDRHPLGGEGVFIDSENDEYDPRLDDLWDEAHAQSCGSWNRIKRFFRGDWQAIFERCDGWHFVRCPDCKGTGLRTAKQGGSDAIPLGYR